MIAVVFGVPAVKHIVIKCEFKVMIFHSNRFMYVFIPKIIKYFIATLDLFTQLQCSTRIHNFVLLVSF